MHLIYCYTQVCICVYLCWAQSCLTLCYPMYDSPPGSSVHGILQARIVNWVAVSYSRKLSQALDRTTSLASAALASGLLITSATGVYMCVYKYKY